MYTYIYIHIYIYMYISVYIYIKLVVTLCVVCFVPLLHILTFKLLILELLIFDNKTLSYDFGK